MAALIVLTLVAVWLPLLPFSPTAGAEVLPAGPAGDPGIVAMDAVSLPGGEAMVAGRDLAGVVWARRYFCRPGECRWGGWQVLDGLATEVALHATDDGRVSLYVRGLSGAIYRASTCTNCRWLPFVNLGGAGDQLDAVEVGSTDCALVSVRGGDVQPYVLLDCDGRTSGWVPQGGQVRSLVSTADRYGPLLVAEGLDSGVWVARPSSGWFPMGGRGSRVGAVSDGSTVTVSLLGGDGRTWSRMPSSPWASTGGLLVTTVGLPDASGLTRLGGTGPDGSLWRRDASGWVSLGGRSSVVVSVGDTDLRSGILGIGTDRALWTRRSAGGSGGWSRPVNGFCAVAPTTTGPCPAPAVDVQVVASGLERPWDIGFTDNGTPIFTEKGGRISVFVGGSVRVLGQVSDVREIGETGLMGLAVDGRDLYVCTGVVGAPENIQVRRYTVNPGYTSLSGPTVLLSGIQMQLDPIQEGRHGGCRVRFRPGEPGVLYVSTGDAAYGGAPALAQRTDSLSGKVLRITTTGAPAPGNPGFARGEVLTLGHRNPQGLAFRTEDHQPFSVEHGTTCDDEVNLLVTGGNYGWAPPAPYDESVPMTDPSRVAGARAAVWRSGCPTLAPSGAAFLPSIGWGGWSGYLAVAFLKGSQLRMMRIPPGFNEVVEDIVTLTTHGRLRSAVVNPSDGSLWVATDGTEILRLAPIT